MKCELYAPASYWTLLPETKAKIVNGCGTSGWKGDLVPDSIWGLNVRPACDIHDYMYFRGETAKDKEEADRTFLNNMLRIINAHASWAVLKWLRRKMALTYYDAVKDFGGPAFWEGKNRSDEMCAVFTKPLVENPLA